VGKLKLSFLCSSLLLEGLRCYTQYSVSLLCVLCAKWRHCRDALSIRTTVRIFCLCL